MTRERAALLLSFTCGNFRGSCCVTLLRLRVYIYLYIYAAPLSLKPFIIRDYLSASLRALPRAPSLRSIATGLLHRISPYYKALGKRWVPKEPFLHVS